MHRLRRLRLQRRDDLLAQSDVYCCTCLGAGSTAQLKGVEFGAVIMDESAQCHEPAALVPLVKGSSHVTLVGDHAQLPAITLSGKAAALGYSTSLFERLKNSLPIPSILLQQQYRMHPDISRFPNKTIYASLLVDMPQNGTEQSWRSSFDPPIVTGREPRTVTFISHDSPETRLPQTMVNEEEAKIVIDVVLDLLRLNPTLRPDDVGIISCYRGQVRCIFDLPSLRPGN